MWSRHSSAYVLQYPTWPVEWVQISVLLAWQDYWATGEPDLAEAFLPLLYNNTRIGDVDPATGLTRGFIEMIELHEQLAHCAVVHIDVCFGTPPSVSLAGQLDAAIGRTAHISFLENASFLQLFVQTYLPYFT